jgi:hypothetical protein
MSEIGGLPYAEAHFDEKGVIKNTVSVPAGTTDLFVISHGWNNNDAEATALYTELFTNFAAVRPTSLDSRRFAVVGVFWPSKKFDELVAVSGVPANATGAAGLAHDSTSHAIVEARVAALKEMFARPEQQQILDEARALVRDLDDKGSARREFVEKIRALLDSSAANDEDASKTFFDDDGNELMKKLNIDEGDLGDDIGGVSGAASMPLTVGTTSAAVGGAAGVGAFLSGFTAAAMNLLNYTTYYTMKTRAGNVGKNGVAPLLDQLAPQVERIHLIGHSFGGRVVTAAAANSTTPKIRSMTLLQAAYSHNGLSKTMKGFFRSVMEAPQRVNGPILITHTKNDKAVGIAYPLASRINGDATAAFGDENDKFGGLGRNGAQKMETGERVPGTLLPVGATYTFVAGKCFNLEASTFISGHSDVRGKEVAYALGCAIA